MRNLTDRFAKRKKFLNQVLISFSLKKLSFTGALLLLLVLLLLPIDGTDGGDANDSKKKKKAGKQATDIDTKKNTDCQNCVYVIDKFHTMMNK